MGESIVEGVEVVRVSTRLLGEIDVDQLKGRIVFLSHDNPAVAKALAECGVACRVAGEALPKGSVLLLVNSPQQELAAVVDRLLGPGGCPWDQAQTHETLKKYLIEEAYEVLDAIDDGNPDSLCEELGDLLLQPYMHAQIRKLRTGEFDIDTVSDGIVSKLIRRHPHVFGDTTVSSADEVLKNWDQIKQGEKKAVQEVPKSILSGIPKAMPALHRAYEVSKRAARSGFEWPDIEGVFEKLREEEAELRVELENGDADRLESEIGDLLFTVVNLARWTKVEPEEALRKMLDRFTKRFEAMESLASVPLRELSAEGWEELWQEAKRLTVK
jgi:tetrapyrrole methylase family protein / MazG family protein